MMSNCKKLCMETRSWSDLPPELLPLIAERLGLIELLSFRCVCKAWRSASSTASAEPESSHEPWFLLYGQKNSDQCQLLKYETGKKYTISIQQLQGATCLASNRGWLLVYKMYCGSMFFFCPFSGAKIDIPPRSTTSITSESVAAFSSPPTSQDCIVCAISRISHDALELNVLHIGANEWTKHRFTGTPFPIVRIKCALFHNGEFYFYQRNEQLITVTVSANNSLDWNFFYIGPASEPEDEENPAFGDEPPPFEEEMEYLYKKQVKKLLGMELFCIATCGTQTELSDGKKSIVYNENMVAYQHPKLKDRRCKGVWIHPRFYQISPNDQSW